MQRLNHIPNQQIFYELANTNSVSRIARILNLMQQRKLDDFPIGLFQIVLAGKDYIIEYCNKHYANLLGFDTPDEVIGRKASDFHLNEQCTKNYYEKLASKDLLKDYRLDSVDSNGNARTFCIDCKKISDENGRIIGRSGVMHDISELDQVKLELETLQTDIGQLLHLKTSP